MPYQANRPLAPDQLSRSQGDINGNFQVLGSIGGNGTPNSAGINPGPGGAGFNYLYLQTVGNPPLGSAFGANTALYSAPFNTKANLFVNKVNNLGNKQYPITASILDTATPANNASGWSYLPSGLIIKWGSMNIPGTAGGDTIVFDATVPFTAVFSIQLTPFVAVNAYVPTAVTLTTINSAVLNKGVVPGSFVAGLVYYFVIGR
jgi:hypothetical protein